MMQLNLPISLDDLEVTHRVGKPSLPQGRIDQADEANQPASTEVSAEAADTEPDDVNPVSAESSSCNATQNGQSQPQVPRPILVKFVSRRVKGDIMSSRKNLKGKKFRDEMFPVFVQDDLTQRRAKLAFQARVIQRNGQIKETWISYGKVMVKDNHNCISIINSTQDLDKYN